MEFKKGDTVTLDRYNHIEDVEIVEIVDIQPSWGLGGGMDYVLDVRGTKIRTSGASIMESKHYKPVPDEDRHCRKNATPQEREEFYLKKFGK